jgi:hypothetical protein
VRLLVGPCFSQLLYNPKCIGISRHIEMQDLPPVVADDEKAVNFSGKIRIAKSFILQVYDVLARHTPESCRRAQFRPRECKCPPSSHL